MNLMIDLSCQHIEHVNIMDYVHSTWRASVVYIKVDTVKGGLLF